METVLKEPNSRRLGHTPAGPASWLAARPLPNRAQPNCPPNPARAGLAEGAQRVPAALVDHRS